jgi:5'-3' exonuclease
MKVHLVDGTYELFRMFFGAPPREAPDGREVGATCALARTLITMIEGAEQATHVGVAFDHVIESFRNDLFDGYKTGDGINPKLFGQFHLAEDLCRALGFVVWPMVEFEADDAIAAAAEKFKAEADQVLLCSPDKDLAQCVEGDRVVLIDRRRKKTYDEAGCTEKYGVPPRLIPDWLGLVGDDADGIPGIPKWGAKSAAAVLNHFGGLEQIPTDAEAWDLKVRGKDALLANLNAQREDAALYRRLAVLRSDAPIAESVADLAWQGADRAALEPLCREIGDTNLLARVPKWR